MTDALGLWAALTAEAGLRPVRRRDGTENYDTALEMTVREELQLGHGEMTGAVRRAGVTLEALLGAVLGGLRPWAAMLQDILAMLEEAAAAHAGQTIGLSVQWSRLAPDLRASLEAFRRWSDEANAVVARAVGPQWGDLNLWDPRLMLGPDPDQEVLPEDFRKWRRAYKDGARFDPPAPPRSGHVGFDRELLRLHAAVRSHLRAARLMGGSTDDRIKVSRDEQSSGAVRVLGDEWTAERVTRVDHDQLAHVALLTAIAAPRTVGWNAATAESQAAALRRVLDEVPVADVAGGGVQRALSDILDLPVWKQRHELYSVWIAAVIRSAAPHAWRWLAGDGALSFAFAGAEVATLDLGPFEGVFWAELSRRATLTRSVVRKSTVKPDYTLLLSDDRLFAAAGLVVECKQYRSPSRRNFDAALTDYAEAHPSAAVALVNYGRVGTTSANDIAAGRSAPVAAFGEVCPGGAGLAPFKAFLRGAFGALEGLALILNQKVKDDGSALISVYWETGGDLDLHVATRDEHWPPIRVGYGAPDDDQARQCLTWSGDRQTPPATETVDICPAVAPAYEVYIQLFSGDWPDEGATVEVTFGPMRFRLGRPSGPGSWWHVGTLRPAEARFEAGGMLAGSPW